MLGLLLTVSVAMAGDDPKLAQNYPNPAKEKTYVMLSLPQVKHCLRYQIF